MNDPNARDEILELFSAKLDGELGAEEERRLEKLLRENPELRDEVEGFQSAVRFVQDEGRRADSEQRAPTDFRAGILARIDEEIERAESRPAAAADAEVTPEPTPVIIRVATFMSAVAALVIAVVWIPELLSPKAPAPADSVARFEESVDVDGDEDAIAPEEGRPAELESENREPADGAADRFGGDAGPGKGKSVGAPELAKESGERSLEALERVSGGVKGDGPIRESKGSVSRDAAPRENAKPRENTARSEKKAAVGDAPDGSPLVRARSARSLSGGTMPTPRTPVTEAKSETRSDAAAPAPTAPMSGEKRDRSRPFEGAVTLEEDASRSTPRVVEVRFARGRTDSSVLRRAVDDAVARSKEQLERSPGTTLRELADDETIRDNLDRRAAKKSEDQAPATPPSSPGATSQRKRGVPASPLAGGGAPARGRAPASPRSVTSPAQKSSPGAKSAGSAPATGGGGRPSVGRAGGAGRVEDKAGGTVLGGAQAGTSVQESSADPAVVRVELTPLELSRLESRLRELGAEVVPAYPGKDPATGETTWDAGPPIEGASGRDFRLPRAVPTKEPGPTGGRGPSGKKDRPENQAESAGKPNRPERVVIWIRWIEVAPSPGRGPGAGER